MVAEELINHMIPPLKVTDSARKAKMWMEELRCNQLPVADQGKFLGLITEEIILEENDIDKSIGDFDIAGKDCVVRKNSHFYEVIKLATDNHVEMVGVEDENKDYCGVITIQDTITLFAQSAAVQVSGGIIVLSLDQRDYSLAEISRLIEENNAKILGSSVKQDDFDPSKLKLTLKLNTIALSSITATLERFGYKIIARFQETHIQEDQRQKVDMLLKYLEI